MHHWLNVLANKYPGLLFLLSTPVKVQHFQVKNKPDRRKARVTDRHGGASVSVF